MPRMGRTLASRILFAVLGIMAVTMALGLALFTRVTSRATDQQAVEQTRSIAVSLGHVPQVATAVEAGDPDHVLRRLAEAVRRDSGASYVVIIGRDGTRYSHPNPALVGQKIEEPVVALDGRVHTGVDQGSLGRSANARAPIFDANGRPVGEVSVGLLESEVGVRFTHEMADVLLYTGAALALGVGASLLLARGIKRVTFGLEPAEIVALVQEREAMLHGIREGVLGIDPSGRINVLNDEARRLLDIQGAVLGQRVVDVLPDNRLRGVVTGEVAGQDLVAVTDEHLLVLNRMPVVVGERQAGWVVTIRDRTELEALLRQLDSVEGLTTALRAQEHEFSNRLHVLSVLLELGEVDEATRYSRHLQADTALVGEEVRSRIGSPVVTALLLAKTTVAAERDVRVRLDPASRLTTPVADEVPIVTVLGNLIDNAVDAVADDPRTVGDHPRGEVMVSLGCEDGVIQMSVSDTGPGISADRLDDVFVDGFSTKEPRRGMRRGVGLALVHRLVTRDGGTITATSPDGARFDVTLPMRRKEVVE
ncbi:two-component system CitB family sensor kinase [Phycicoccus badiiscoriae]|uniref:Sensor-like histidine kinase SenX3 n=1 Tax=Pedococcus badiiscoriae TaxID=642776 RepID=A0A852WKS0_9MICO|nr:sensor histidine kinase [Pedococcus badiiscoriae]NYG06815.1 two-component system CitB family sensor kinase [Pedococcus badiiscoriae]